MTSPTKEWAVIELSGEHANKRLDVSLYPSQSVSAFFEWQLRDQHFDFGVVYKDRLLTLVDKASASANTLFLEKSAQRGWELLISTTCTTEVLKTFFAAYGYKQASEATLHLDSKHELFSWNGANLSAALAWAERLRATHICLFAHDADPIYLLQSNLETHT